MALSDSQVVLYLIALCVGPCKSVRPACHLEIIKAVAEYEYIKEGDVLIGGIMTGHISSALIDPGKSSQRLLCIDPHRQNSKLFVDFQFAIEQINKNPDLLPNVSLGYHIYDSCGDVQKAVKSVLQILSGTREPLPNYSCVGKRNIAGFIGDGASETTVPIAQILSTVGLSQISYGATDPLLGDRFNFPYFFRTVQSDEGYYFALGKLLKKFGWNWIGIVISDGISAFQDQQLLKKYLFSEGICVEFTAQISKHTYKDADLRQDMNIIWKSTTSVIIICGTFSTVLLGKLSYYDSKFKEKTFILPPHWGANGYIINYAAESFNGSLVFVQMYSYDLNIPEMKNFLDDFHPSKYPEDKLVEDIWMIFHFCLSKDSTKNQLYEYVYLQTLHNCTGKETITSYLYSRENSYSPRVHLAVHMMAHAIQDLHNLLNMQSPGMNTELYEYKHQLHHFLRNLHYEVPQGRSTTFDDRGEFISNYGIQNYIIIPPEKVVINFLGTFTPWEPYDQLSINSASIIWKTKNRNPPRAQCSDNCPTGFRKASKLGAQICCYDCIQCSEGEISTRTDSEYCIQCPDMEWPNQKKDQCVSKLDDYLSYTKEFISVLFLLISFIFMLIAIAILWVFISNRDTPIVRSNNRSLSFVLLVSIKLSFLSVFLFLGRPVDITCMLRNITFGITFSIAVSSLLAKTIMVCVAFKATKPGSSWRKWVGVKLSNSVVLFCSSIQIIICMTWLAISPPFQELDLHTYPGTIIIQCNEGSAIGFYSVIGYMGLLAAVSFVLAFLARTLPDSFNEAKYITFSMLLFCSVWITMIPAYLSTKGKNTVCVEIFAILTSSAGLLASIFLPKCYIILLRPEMNTKSNLNRKTRSA
ncbi:hypothetical protein XELAEV_18003667mg [Xenopus laevis]|nr:hypothetical protein XELAEV_18003667mg [Xenopus laevis]